MKTLRIIQGGINNGDKILIDKLAANHGTIRSWTAPKDSMPGDEVVIYVKGSGFYATGIISSEAKLRQGWVNRYGVSVGNIKLIDPPISINAIKRHIPSLTWAIYPRSITTPNRTIASEIRKLIKHRRKTGLPDLDDDALKTSNLEELFKVAILRARASLPARMRKTIYRASSLAIILYVIQRSKGFCESCNEPAPFLKLDGTPYLEPHHTSRRADDGPDHPLHVIALCPNCHRRAHHADDAMSFNNGLIKLLRRMKTSK